MRLTKYEHACVVLERSGEYLVIDPGGLSGSFVVPENCVGVVVTHEHFDHLDQKKLTEVIQKNPEVKVYANEDVVAQLKNDLKSSAITVKPGETHVAGSFKLQFAGGLHEATRPELTRCKNTGVIVDKLFYHPGDEHYVPEQPVQWLGVPLNAPWSKVSETCEFVKAVKATHAIPIHDGLLSTEGVPTYESHVVAACETTGTNYTPMKVGESIELT